MPASILVVLLGSLGDICRALPVLCLLRAHWPHVRLTWAVDERWSPLAAAHRAADRLVVFPNPRTIAGLARFARDLRAERYDLTLDMQRILKSGLCTYLSASPRRLGFNRADTKERNHWFTNERIPAISASVSKVTHYLAFARHLGVPIPERLPFGLDHLVDRSCLPDIPVRRAGLDYAVLVAGSSWPSKNWSAAGYADLARRILADTSLSIVLVGGPDHGPLVPGLEDGSRVTNLVGKTSLIELAAILGCARVAVGPDTGAGHLAAAVGTPYVALTGPTNAARVAPYGCATFVVSSPGPCDGCGRRCRRRTGRCMDTITADAVWTQARRALENRRFAPQDG